MKRAFTLIELLVVIGVLAALMGLLLPTLNVAREQARSTQCLSNLRQMSVAATSYVTSNRGFFPPALSASQVVNGRAVSATWDYTIEREIATGKVTVRPGTLWQGETIDKIHQCPSFDGKSNTFADPYTGYNYNTSYIGHGHGETPITIPARLAQIKQPSQTVLFGDGQMSTGANKFMRAPFPDDRYDNSTSTRSAGTQGFRHRSKTNVSYVDGHAESLKARFTSTTPSQQPRLGNNCGFLSADNSLYDLE